MATGSDIGDILRQDAGGQQGSNQVEQDFDQVAPQADPEHLKQGLTEVIRSDHTPPFGEMLGQLFGQADDQQRAGLLSHLLAGAGPSLIGSMLGTAGGRGLGGFLGDGAGMGAMGALLGKLTGGSSSPAQLDPEDVGRLSPEQMQELATHAERENPGVVEHVSQYLAQHPDLVKGLGAGMLAMLMGKLAQRRQ